MSTDMSVVLLWSFAVFLASVFAAVICHITLKPKKNIPILATRWGLAAILGFGAAVISYRINITNDLVGILGLTAILCVAVHRSYEGEASEKLFISLMAALMANVSTFMFCGTTDTYIGAALHLFDCGTPYNIPNIELFIGIKLVVYTIVLLLYNMFVLKKVKHVLELSKGHMHSYLIAPAVSVVAFYAINLITNAKGIMPTDPWFMPLYGVICLIFIFEYIQIFNSVKWAAAAMENAKEKERIGAELNVATQIQADMLPSIFPAFPGNKHFDIYASMQPAKEVGGDFYDFFLIDDDHIGLVMADVSGKGVPAALFMVVAKTLIKNRAMMGGTPAEILSYVNDQLCEGNKAELFVTVWLAIVDLNTGKGKAANAGHEHPVLRKAGGTYELVKYRHSPAVATMEGIRFKEHDFELQPGDRIYVYTDGVPEATSINDELYGTDRMMTILARCGGMPLKELCKTIREDIADFTIGAPQFDDITMLAFDYFGPGGEQ